MDAEQAAAVAELYARVDAVVAGASPRCEQSGRCCRFERSGLQLWTSTLEVAYARAAAGGEVPPAPSGRCPWHVDGLCRLRDGRPLGCRLYFCDPRWEPGMPAIYERFHAELVGLHERFAVPYRYRPFVDAVTEPEIEAP